MLASRPTVLQVLTLLRVMDFSGCKSSMVPGGTLGCGS